jgi:hypothetical protein
MQPVASFRRSFDRSSPRLAAARSALALALFSSHPSSDALAHELSVLGLLRDGDPATRAVAGDVHASDAALSECRGGVERRQKRS